MDDSLVGGVRSHAMNPKNPVIHCRILESASYYDDDFMIQKKLEAGIPVFRIILDARVFQALFFSKPLGTGIWRSFGIDTISRHKTGTDPTNSPGGKIERIIWFCDEPIAEIRENNSHGLRSYLRIFFHTASRYKKIAEPGKKESRKNTAYHHPFHISHESQPDSLRQSGSLSAGDCTRRII
ncbi:MAG: hypothetical protein M0Q92_12570 [Methanoregula sp.]|jgi:hypothetical protein|nr:hypothetical protein [Methanoregula sp.]